MYLNLPTYPRFLTAAAGSAIVTSSLLYLMVQLVAFDDLQLVESPPFVPIDIYEVRDEPPPEIKTEQPEPPPEVTAEPPPPPLLPMEGGDKGVELAELLPEVTRDLKIGPVALVDGEPVALVKVAPNYPHRAKIRGIQGFVTLSFTITETGATSDIQVVEAQPSGIFDNAALQAVRKFKYKPKVIDGTAHPVHNVLHRLTFELANG